MAGPDDDSLHLETPRAAVSPPGIQPIPTQPKSADPTVVPSPTSTPPGQKGNRRRTLLFAGIGVVLVLCLIGAIAGYVTYDRATRLDRSQPFVTLYQYLEYGFNQHDPDRAKLFRCKDPDLGPLDAFFAQLSDIERQNDITFELQAANKPVQYSGNTATMSTNLILREPNRAVTGREVDPWEFRFRNEDGWRLCGAKPLPKPSSSPK